MDFQGIVQAITQRSEDTFGDNEVAKTLTLFIVNFLVLLGSIALMADIIPPEIDILAKRAIPISLVASLVITGFGYVLKASAITKSQLLSFGLSLGVVGSILILSIIFVVLSNVQSDDYVQREDFESAQEKTVLELENIRSVLLNADLSSEQVAQVEAILLEKQVVTLDQLRNIALTSEQIQQVVDELPDILSREDVVGIFNEESTRVAEVNAAATVQAEQTTCYIEANVGYTSVTIRKSPIIEDGNRLKFLFQGERLIAVGHNGKVVNQDRWWLIQFQLGGETVYGWVSSLAVKEINEPACMALGQIPGS